MAESEPEELNHVEERLANEMARMPHEPLLPVEKRLIGWSLALGVTLLGILMWVSVRFFPV